MLILYTLLSDTTHSKTPAKESTTGSVTLTLEQRQKTRLRTQLDDGREAGIRLPRHSHMTLGSLLLSEQGEVVEVKAAPETVSVASTTDSLLLKRACYHLGNRHVQLQITEGWVAYQSDHVLDEMVKGLGLSVETREQPFEPEDGAYSHGHSHDHSQNHSHHDGDSHSHDHKHDHSHSHSH